MEVTLWVLVCVVVADFATGFFHWFEDTWVTPKTPLIGKSIGEPNVEHHRQPNLMGMMGTWITRNLISVILCLVAVFIFWLCNILCWQLVLVAMLASLGNEVHQWNHMAKPKNAVTAFLQDSAIIQTRQQHALHHKKPYDRYYCTLTNFTNAVLERIRFWRGLEKLCVAVGFKMKRLSQEREGY